MGRLFKPQDKARVLLAVEKELPLRANLKNPGLASAPLTDSRPFFEVTYAPPASPPIVQPPSPMPQPAPAPPSPQNPMTHAPRIIVTPPPQAAPAVPLVRKKVPSPMQLQTDLLTAITMGDEKKVGDLAAQGADVNLPQGGNGMTPIMMASKYGYPRIIAILHTCGAYIDDKDNRKWTALMHAVNSQQPKSASALILLKADLDIPDENGITPVQASILKSDNSMLEMLLDAGASVDTWNMHHETPLMTAIDTEDISTEPRMTRMVLAKEPDLGAVDTQMNTALFHAIKAKNTKLVGLLLKAGADPNQAGPGDVSPIEFAKSMGLIQIRMQIYWHGGR